MKKGGFEILHGISENITLVQLTESVGNVNYAVIIFGYWIFEYNYKKALPLILDSLNPICYPLVGEGMFSMCEKVFHSVRYINNTGKLNISD